MIIGANVAGILNKQESLQRIINRFNPGVIFLQETKLRHKNRIKLKNYNVFENLRTDSAGGGVLTAIHEAFKPVCISDEHDDILVIEALIGTSKVRFINGYGPQETENTNKKELFYDALT